MNWTKCFQTQNCAVIHKVLHKGVSGYTYMQLRTAGQWGWHSYEVEHPAG